VTCKDFNFFMENFILNLIFLFILLLFLKVTRVLEYGLVNLFFLFGIILIAYKVIRTLFQDFAFLEFIYFKILFYLVKIKTLPKYFQVFLLVVY
jgi:hypothetical protein